MWTQLTFELRIKEGWVFTWLNGWLALELRHMIRVGWKSWKIMKHQISFSSWNEMKILAEIVISRKKSKSFVNVKLSYLTETLMKHKEHAWSLSRMRNHKAILAKWTILPNPLDFSNGNKQFICLLHLSTNLTFWRL